MFPSRISKRWMGGNFHGPASPPPALSQFERPERWHDKHIGIVQLHRRQYQPACEKRQQPQLHLYVGEAPGGAGVPCHPAGISYLDRSGMNARLQPEQIDRQIALDADVASEAMRQVGAHRSTHAIPVHERERHHQGGQRSGKRQQRPSGKAAPGGARAAGRGCMLRNGHNNQRFAAELRSGNVRGANALLGPRRNFPLARTFGTGGTFSPRLKGPAGMKRLTAWTLLREGVNAFVEDHALTRGAAIAFYAVTAIAPVLFIATAIAALGLGESTASGAVHFQLRRIMSKESADLVQAAILHVRGGHHTVLGSVIG